LFVALVSPLDALGGALFSAHMVQHLTLILVAAPLLVLGRPERAILWIFPRNVRRRIGAWWHRSRLVRPGWRILTLPLVVWVLHAAAVWIWHAASFYEAALRNDTIHSLEHASFLGTALLFWWVLLAAGRRLDYGLSVMFVFTTMMYSGVLGALITFASVPWYPGHAEGARLWGLSLIEDQQLAGVLMWIPASIIYLLTAAALFVCWLRHAEEVQRRRGRARRPAVAVGRPVVGRLPNGSRVRLIGALAGVALLTACDNLPKEHRPQAVVVLGGDPEAGRVALQGFGCIACHSIPGVPGVRGSVGPQLDGFARRMYVAGVLPNQPDGLIEWIQDPQSVNPGTAMPNLGVVEPVARDMAAYLYTLR
jgi:putative membrane protein